MMDAEDIHVKSTTDNDSLLKDLSLWWWGQEVLGMKSPWATQSHRAWSFCRVLVALPEAGRAPTWRIYEMLLSGSSWSLLTPQWPSLHSFLTLWLSDSLKGWPPFPLCLSNEALLALSGAPSCIKLYPERRQEQFIPSRVCSGSKGPSLGKTNICPGKICDTGDIPGMVLWYCRFQRDSRIPYSICSSWWVYEKRFNLTNSPRKK